MRQLAKNYNRILSGSLWQLMSCLGLVITNYQWYVDRNEQI